MPNAILNPADIEAIERATVAAVAPQAIEELDGWLLAFDTGAVNRAKCAVPLRHAAPDATVLPAIEARYADRDMPALFRIPDSPAFEAMRVALTGRGYGAGRPTLVQVAAAATVARVSSAAAVELAAAPDTSWAAVFLGAGFDPVDGASRVKALGRTPGSLYASVREDGRAIAAGVGAFGYGWASVHGMRTGQARRGEGLAGRVLAALAAAALERGVERMFLQVEAENPPALALYRRAGFATAWAYEYWQRA
ncbi:MAG: GNAT family N-acetyltransferase [Betaproteobacteria bacterium]|nr:GNAT family N-acetyltransferase [Betaproteobacteria bacterium]